MPFVPWVATIGNQSPPLSVANGGTGVTTGTLVNQASTPLAGYTMINGTGVICSWTVPNDGKLHRAQCFLSLNVSSAETGGAITFTYTDPGGGAGSAVAIAAAQGTGTTRGFTGAEVQAGTVVAVNQNTALTVGAAVLYGEIWGS